tara:strand:+ start:524 stop:892 length:369 start_codon:yes stop_codon:yes gene_type:complete
MKNYMMWLIDTEVATWDNTLGELIVPEGTNIYADELVTKYQNDTDWHSPWLGHLRVLLMVHPTIKIDDDDFIIDDEEELIIDDGDLDDCAYTPEEYWFTESGGLTGDAYNFLYNADIQGELI